MQVHVERDEEGRERPCSFRAGDHKYFVEEHLDTWFGIEDTWYKVRANDGNLYILRHQPSRAGNPWSLESFRQQDPAERQLA